MKKAVQLAFCACLLAISTFGQDAAAPKTNTTIQCRALNGSSTPIRADEKVIGDQICRAVQKAAQATAQTRSEEHTSELQSRRDLVCRLLLEKKKNKTTCNNTLR